MERGDASAPCGFEDGADVGVELGAPLRAEAVRHFSEDNAGPDRLLGAVVGRRHVAIGDKDEEVLTELLDHALELVALAAFGAEAQKRIELVIELSCIAAQRGIGQLRASPGAD